MDFDRLPWPYSFLATNVLNLSLEGIINITYEIAPKAANSSAPPDVAVYNGTKPMEEPGVIVIHWGPGFVYICLLTCGFMSVLLLRYASDVYTILLITAPEGKGKENSIVLPKRTTLLRGFIPATILGITRTVVKTLVTGFLAFFVPEILCGYLGRIVAYTVFARWAMVVTHIQISAAITTSESQWWIRTWPIRVLSTSWLLALPTLGPLVMLAVTEGIVVSPSIIAELLHIPAELYLVLAQAAVLRGNYDSLVSVDTTITRRKAKKVLRWIIIQKIMEAVVGVVFIFLVHVLMAVMTGRFWMLVEKAGYIPGTNVRDL